MSAFPRTWWSSRQWTLQKLSNFNPLDSKGNYSATSNNRKLVHWPLMGGLLHLVQRGGTWAGCGPAQSPPRCTKWRHQWKSGLSPHFWQLFLENLFSWLSPLFVCALHLFPLACLRHCSLPWQQYGTTATVLSLLTFQRRSAMDWHRASKFAGYSNAL